MEQKSIQVSPNKHILDAFWSIPPIQDTIDSYLTQKDLAQLVQVSTTLHKAFNPFLWREIRLTSIPTSRFFQSKAQLSQRQHTRTLLVMDPTLNPDSVDQLEPLPRLNHLSVICWKNPRLPVFSTFAFWVQAHATLERLELNIESSVRSCWIIPSIITLLPKLARLQHVVLDVAEKLSGEEWINIFRSCSGIRKVILEGRFYSNQITMELADLDLLQTGIKDLRISLFGHGRGWLCVALAACCPLLERLELAAKFTVEGLAARLVETLERCCPELQALVFYSGNPSEAVVIPALKSCKGLKEFSCWLQGSFAPIFPVLVGLHGETLEKLDIASGEPLNFLNLFCIAGSCPGLKALKVAVGWRYARDLEEEMYRKELGRWPWVCMGLKSLSVSLFTVDIPMVPVTSWDAFYGQVGRLVHLRTLDIIAEQGSNELTDSFMNGLDHLGDLKALKGLSFMYRAGQPLNVEQMVRVMGVWPRLESFEGRMSTGTKVLNDKNALLYSRAMWRECGGW